MGLRLLNGMANLAENTAHTIVGGAKAGVNGLANGKASPAISWYGRALGYTYAPTLITAACTMIARKMIGDAGTAVALIAIAPTITPFAAPVAAIAGGIALDYAARGIGKVAQRAFGTNKPVNIDEFKPIEDGIEADDLEQSGLAEIIVE